MSGEAENKMEVDGEPQEVLEVARDPSPESFKDKYKTLKDRLKYLVYVSVCGLNGLPTAVVAYACKGLCVICVYAFFQEHECFEVEVQHAQAKLLELTHDKRFAHARVWLLGATMSFSPSPVICWTS